MNETQLALLRQRAKQLFIENMSTRNHYVRISLLGEDGWIGYKKGIGCWLVDQGSVSRASLTKRIMMADQGSAITRYFDIRTGADLREANVVTSRWLRLLNVLR